MPVDQQAILGIQVLLALNRIQVSEDGRTELAGPRKSVGGFTTIAFDQSQPLIQMDFDGKPMLYESCKVYFHVIYVMIPNPGTVLEHLNDAARSTCREQGTDCQFPSWILL